MNENVVINRLASGVPGLDSLLGGGLPEFSFNVITGAPGSGKTTLAYLIMFAHAKQNRRSVYFTVLGESALKMMRYQQQFSFFDTRKINESVKFVNLSADLATGNFDSVLAGIIDEATLFAPSMVFIDSFRAGVRSVCGDDHNLQHFVQLLALRMASRQATTFLIGEYLSPDTDASPVFTLADGIVSLAQNIHGNAMVRRIKIIKIRGQAQVPGWHTFRIDKDGLRIFLRAIVGPGAAGDDAPRGGGNVRVSMGIPGLDALAGGGLPAGYSLLVVGPFGSGKIIVATEFLAEGARKGEFGVLAAFEKSPSQLLRGKLDSLMREGMVGVVNTRSLDLSIDETLQNLIEMIEEKPAKRLVIDSLSGFELALAPEFHEGFRASLFRMMAVLISMGVIVLLTSELEDHYADLRFSPYGNAFLADTILMLRYIEIEGDLKRIISVVKISVSDHKTALHFFCIAGEGILMGESLSQYTGILTGSPVKWAANPLI